MTNVFFFCRYSPDHNTIHIQIHKVNAIDARFFTHFFSSNDRKRSKCAQSMQYATFWIINIEQ